MALAHRSSVFILSVYKVLRVSASPLADKMEINPHPSLLLPPHSAPPVSPLLPQRNSANSPDVNLKWSPNQNAPHDMNSNGGTTATPSHINFHAKLSSTSHGPLLRKHKLWHAWWGNVSNLSLGNDKIVVNYNFTLYLTPDLRPPPPPAAPLSEGPPFYLPAAKNNQQLTGTGARISSVFIKRNE